ncbi:MAG TPA: hypothetical protein ENF20_01535 [Candidatus Marinimicrobia bacterium]|nr:hypothetical protein [Candidatus Neomarinimicrobiota bacterium]
MRKIDPVALFMLLTALLFWLCTAVPIASTTPTVYNRFPIVLSDFPLYFLMSLVTISWVLTVIFIFIKCSQREKECREKENHKKGEI